MKKSKIFLGGCYSETVAIRKRVATYGKLIEKVIEKSGYTPSLNLLSNPSVHDETKSADGILFPDGQSFLKVGQAIIGKIKKYDLDSIRAIRSFPSDQDFMLSVMACNIALSELRESIAGIFELSFETHGSYSEIYKLLEYKRPVLALSHEADGRPFGRMLVGYPSRLLITERFSASSLEQVVESFLSDFIKEKMMVTKTLRIPVELDLKIAARVKKNGTNNESEVIRDMIERGLSEEGKL